MNDLVADIMTADVRSCRPTDSANDCARIMWEHRCGCVPVVDDDMVPLAMVTDRDLCMAAYIRGRPLTEIDVASVMSKRIFTVHAESPVGRAAAIMRRHRIRRLPVVGKKGLVGIISVDDILRRADVHHVTEEAPFSADSISSTASALRHEPTHR